MNLGEHGLQLPNKAPVLAKSSSPSDLWAGASRGRRCFVSYYGNTYVLWKPVRHSQSFHSPQPPPGCQREVWSMLSSEAVNTKHLKCPYAIRRTQWGGVGQAVQNTGTVRLVGIPTPSSWPSLLTRSFLNFSPPPPPYLPLPLPLIYEELQCRIRDPAAIYREENSFINLNT